MSAPKFTDVFMKTLRNKTCAETTTTITIKTVQQFLDYIEDHLFDVTLYSTPSVTVYRCDFGEIGENPEYIIALRNQLSAAGYREQKMHRPVLGEYQLYSLCADDDNNNKLHTVRGNQAHGFLLGTSS